MTPPDDDATVVVRNFNAPAPASWQDLQPAARTRQKHQVVEVVERVARLEERFDGMTTAIAELKVEVSGLRVEVRDLDTRMQTGFAELRAEMHTASSAVRSEMQTGFAAVRGEMHSDMHSQLRWIMGDIGGAVLATLLAVLAAVMALR